MRSADEVKTYPRARPSATAVSVTLNGVMNYVNLYRSTALVFGIRCIINSMSVVYGIMSLMSRNAFAFPTRNT